MPDTPSVPSIPDLAERLRELDAKATPGPWEADEDVAVNRHPDIYAGRAGLIAEVGNAELGVEDQWEANAALIVALRNSLPEIISALEELSRLKAGEADDALLKRLSEAAFEEWKAMSLELAPFEVYHWPHGDPSNHKFVAASNYRIIRAILRALPPAPGGRSDGPLPDPPSIPTPPARGGNPPEGWTGDIIDD